jgi:hypothetical protein
VYTCRNKSCPEKKKKKVRKKIRNYALISLGAIVSLCATLTFGSYVLQDVKVAFFGHLLAEINVETHVGPHRVPYQTLLLSVAKETHKIPPLFGVLKIRWRIFRFFGSS